MPQHLMISHLCRPFLRFGLKFHQRHYLENLVAALSERRCVIMDNQIFVMYEVKYPIAYPTDI